ncbi:MAG TPA: alkaline phosphatase family protein [Thermoanaerobaculia bacterium]
MAGVIYVLISLYLPSQRRLIFGVDKGSGRVRLVRNRVTFLPPHQFYRLNFDKREGAAQGDGLIRILSKEQVPVTINYRLRFSVATESLSDSRTLVREGWSAWIRRRVGEAVSAVTQQVPIEELLSPTSQFAARRGVLREAVARHLARNGLQVTAFEIARIEADREALLAHKRAELRRLARGVAGRVAIFAIDGADWELISELADDGRVPNLRALAQGGATATLQGIQPTVSPLLWTTAATGVTPDRHGIIDFFEGGAARRPVQGSSRRAPAIWEISEAFGRKAMVVNWWGAWPPRVSGAVTYDAPVDHLRSAIDPVALKSRLGQLEIAPETIGYRQVGRFLNITETEYNNAVAARDPNDPVNVFRGMLAKTWSDHSVAINLYRQQEPLLFLMQYEGTDVVNHLFAPYHPPYREGISQTSFRRYWPTVANYYAEVDRLLGEWMNVLPDDTTVIVMSAHGFRWGKTRPRVQPIGRSALQDHRGTGMFIAYGNHVAPSRASRTVSLYDIVPTVLTILGLPKSAEMPGQHVAWAFNNIQPVESVRVVSYNEFVGGRAPTGGPAIDAGRYTRALQAMGHLYDPSRAAQMVAQEEDGEQPAGPRAPIPPQQWASYAWYNNHGIQLRKQQKLKEASDAFERAIQLNPNHPTPYLNMAMTMFDRQQYTVADELFLTAITKGLPNGDRWFSDFAALYRSQNMTSRAIQLLYQGRKLFPQSHLIAANLGSALAQAERYTEGLPELERALGLQPSSTLVLNNLGIFHAKQKDYGRALDFWNRSLTIDPRQPGIRNAANAARTHL